MQIKKHIGLHKDQKKLESVSAKINFLPDLTSNKILSHGSISEKCWASVQNTFNYSFTKDRVTIFKWTVYLPALHAREPYPSCWLLPSYLLYSRDCFTATKNSPSPKLNYQPLKSCWINQYFWLHATETNLQSP